MLIDRVLVRVRCAAHVTLLSIGLATLPFLHTQAGTVTLAWDPSPDPTVVGYYIYYGSVPGNYTNKVSAGNQLTVGIQNLSQGLTYYFAATAHTADSLESDFSAEVSAYIPPVITNLPPVALQMNLTATEDQPRTFTLSGTDPDQDPLSFQIVSPPSHGTLSGTAPNLNYLPSPNYFGADNFTFRVNDGFTNSPPATVSITVAAVNDAPTINSLANLNLNENAGTQTVALSGITSGAANEPDTLTVTAFSSNRSLIPDPIVTYSSPSSTGSLAVSPAPNASGTANITVSVNDGTLSRSTTFLVSVAAPRPGSNSPPSISLIVDQVTSKSTSAGPISFVVGDLETPASDLLLSALSSDPSLLPATNIVFAGTGTNRSVTLLPLADRTGEVLITLSVYDGQTNSSTSFSLTVLPPNSRLALKKDGEGSIYTSVSGNVYTISAVAAAGQVFCGWSGSIDSASPKLKLAIRTNTLLRAHFSPITVRTTGSGYLVPNIGGMRNLVAGKTYRITAVPRPGYEFSHWTDPVSSQERTLTFVMEPGMTIAAEFVPSPFIPISGSYFGLFHEPDQVQHLTSGSFNLTVNRRGYYSGRLLLGGKAYPFVGKFNLDLTSTRSISRPGKSPLLMHLRSGTGDQADQILGTLSEDSAWIANIVSDRAVFNARNNSAPYAGRYTFILPAVSPVNGHGFGTVILNRGGLALFSGKLADNTAFTRFIRVSKNGFMPFYVPLYRGQGSILAWLTLADETDSDFHGTASWTRPQLSASRFYSEGFTNLCEIAGSLYVRPVGQTAQVLELAAPLVSFSWDNATEAFANELAFGSFSAVKNLGTNRMSMTFNRANGTFRGGVLDPASGTASSFGGVAFQKQNAGFGLILGTNTTGSVVLTESNPNN